MTPPSNGECPQGFALAGNGLCYRDNVISPPAPINPTDPNSPKNPTVNPPEHLEPSCSDLQYTAREECEDNGGIWDEAGRCSIPQYTTQAECEGAEPPGIWHPDPNPDYDPNYPPGIHSCPDGYLLADDLKCYHKDDFPPFPHQCRVDHVWDASLRICVERGGTLGNYAPKIDANPREVYKRDELSVNTIEPNHFRPDVDLHLYLHSTPLHLGYAHSHEEDGSFASSHQIPNEADVGDHHVVATSMEFEFDTLLHAQAAAKVKVQVLSRAPQYGKCIIAGVLAPEYNNREDCEHAGGTWVPEPGVCYIGSTHAPQYTTHEECEASGGSWLSGHLKPGSGDGKISPGGVYVRALLILSLLMLCLALILRESWKSRQFLVRFISQLRR